MKKLFYLTLLFTMLVPLVVYAQATGIGSLIEEVGNLINPLISIVIAIALLVFFIGLVRFIFKLGGEENIEEGKKLMLWGLIALFVMVSVWGIVGFFQESLDLPRTTLPPSPEDLPNLNPFELPPNEQNA